jgi:AcrR family transcriptional regulator
MQESVKIPTTRNGITTFNLLLKASEACFFEKGYHGTTVADITQKAGVAAGTFYLYFPSKMSLYRHLLNELSRDIRKEIASNIDRSKARSVQERAGIKAFLEYAIKNPHMYQIIWESLYIDRSLFQSYYDAFAKRYVKGLATAQENGEMDGLDLEIVAYILMGITNFLGLKIILDMGQTQSKIEEVVDTIMHILNHGLFKAE